MAKNGVFKKITALAMAIALVVCFAVSASADVEVNTTTAYVTGSNEIKVNVTVTGVSENANVTYYATKGGADVHIDQAKASGTTATFEFNVDGVEDLDSNVKIGYTGASAATDADITGYTVTYPGGSKVIPTEATSVTFGYTPTANKDVDQITVTGDVTGAVGVYENGSITVTFTDATGDFAVAVTEKDSVVETSAVPELIQSGAAYVKENAGYDAGFKIDGYYDENGNKVTDPELLKDYNANAVGNRKLTVIGKATDAEEFGIIISETAIVAKQYTEAEFANFISFKALEKNAEGKFAVQVIDTANNGEAELVKADTPYYTAVYVKDAKGVYEVSVSVGTVEAVSGN